MGDAFGTIVDVLKMQQKLIAAGHRVAVAEQGDDPAVRQDAVHRLQGSPVGGGGLGADEQEGRHAHRSEAPQQQPGDDPGRDGADALDGADHPEERWRSPESLVDDGAIPAVDAEAAARLLDAFRR